MLVKRNLIVLAILTGLAALVPATARAQSGLAGVVTDTSGAVTTPGVTISRPYVGGSEGYQITNNTVHGSNARDMSLQIDGLGATTANGDGSNTDVYHNDLAYEEVSFQTSGIGAEFPAGG